MAATLRVPRPPRPRGRPVARRDRRPVADEADLAGLLRSWPAADPRFELVVVDNGSPPPPPPPSPTSLSSAAAPGAVASSSPGAASASAVASTPDSRRPGAAGAHPQPRRLAGAGGARRPACGVRGPPRAAGVAPRLIGPDGTPQWAWQLRPLPGLGRLLAQALFLPAAGGPRREPPAGARIGKPAAAALALPRSALEMPDSPSAGPTGAPAIATSQGASRAPRGSTFGFDEVPPRLVRGRRPRAPARRRRPAAPLLARRRLPPPPRGERPALGYGRFLWIYYRNLARYLRKHHGAATAGAVRALSRSPRSFAWPWCRSPAAAGREPLGGGSGAADPRRRGPLRLAAAGGLGG